MRLRRCTVEYPFATIKYRISGHPRLLMRGLSGARVEIGLATMAYNLKRITNVLGATKLTQSASSRLIEAQPRNAQFKILRALSESICVLPPPRETQFCNDLDPSPPNLTQPPPAQPLLFQHPLH
jgi:hypothetical protein